MTFTMTQDMAGQEFDRLFDFDAATIDSKDYLQISRAGNNAPTFPVSPSSTTHSDSNNGPVKAFPVHAASSHDLPTPDHSSSSPETRLSTDMRLSGDTLRGYPSISPRPSLKRKLSPNDTPKQDLAFETSKAPAKKRPHNVVEKRYRANLNVKIAELRDSVPSLRLAKKAKDREEGNYSSGEEDFDNFAPGSKLNKASILTKAVEYIRHLEFRSKKLEDENRTLKERLETLDKVIANGNNNEERTAAFTSTSMVEVTPNEADADEHSSEGVAHDISPPEGLIPVPDAFRRLRQNTPQEHYGHLYENRARSSIFKSKWPTRVMVGSLAGLMVIEGFGEKQASTESTAKGLFGIPLELLDGWKFLRSPRVYLAMFAHYCRAGGIIPLAKGFFTLTLVAFLIFAYLFNSKPASKRRASRESIRSTETTGPASPIEVRRQAWSTSMQALGLPHHKFFAEWFAVTSEWIKYSTMYLFGSQMYFWVTGRTPEDEVARVKAWDIAIDAQLAGGDTEVSRSRVVLTSFGAGTLPRTPLRLMLKALHCRVLLWNVGKTGFIRGAPWLASSIGRYFSNKEWRRARKQHEDLCSQDVDQLPAYLATLLSMECDDVFLDAITQRAYNLMYDRPTYEHSEDELMDVVVEDYAIRSPLDALAAWRSTCALRNAVDTINLDCSARELIESHLELAMRLAPPGSTAETRAIAFHAVVHPSNRAELCSRAEEALAQSTYQSSGASTSDAAQGPFFIDSSTPASARPDIAALLDIAKVMLTSDAENPENSLHALVSCQTYWQKPGALTLAAAKFAFGNIMQGQRGAPVSPVSPVSPVNMQVLEMVRSKLSSSYETSLTCHSGYTVSLHGPFDEESNVEKGRRRSNDTGYCSLEEEDCIGHDYRMEFQAWQEQQQLVQCPLEGQMVV